MQFLYYLI